MTTLSTRRAGVRLAAASVTDEGVFSGYGSVFNVMDSYGTVMMPGCFRDSLAAHAAAGTRPRGLWQHDWYWPTHTWTSLAEDEHGLTCEGKLVLEVEKAREAHALMKADAIDGLSIGFNTLGSEDVSVEEAEQNYGIAVDDGVLALLKQSFVRLITAVDLVEISIVTFPACASATVETVNAAPAGTPAPDTRRLAALARAQRAQIAHLRHIARIL